MGFALNIEEWLTPYEDDWGVEREDTMIEMWDTGAPINEIYDVFLNADADYLTTNYPLEVITEEEFKALPKDCEVVAYRIGINYDAYEEDGIPDSDFHFKVRRNGQWYEKTGGAAPTKCDLETDKPWEAHDGLLYDSRIIYFVTTT